MGCGSLVVCDGVRKGIQYKNDTQQLIHCDYLLKKEQLKESYFHKPQSKDLNSSFEQTNTTDQYNLI